MEKILNNRNSILFTITIILLLLVGLTVYKVYEKHMTRSFLVVEKRIIEAAKSCVWDGVCNEKEILLGKLITSGYAKGEVNPKTKMYYSHNSYVLVNENQYTFFEVNE